MRPASTSADDPRRRAVEVLARTDAHGAHAARLLGGATAATREITLGVLRWRATLDHLLAPHLTRPPEALDAAVRACLRVGVYEALRMDTPRAVAVSEAVRVAKEMAPRAAGLVNAVLRRATAEAWPDPGDERLPLGVRYSHPEWLVGRWIAMLGEATARAVLAADQTAAPLCLLAATVDAAELAATACRAEPHPHVPGVLVCRDRAAAAAALVAAGRGYAIDATAVAVARALPDVDGPVVDLTAAPGGKSLVLASERTIVSHVALDRHPGRAAMMRANTARAARPPAVVVADATRAPLRPGSCAAVLLDAPCSGTGTLRRHPEIRWRLRPQALVELAGVQRELARRAAELLRPGGFLLYATCSLEPEENAEVVAGLGLEVVSLDDRLSAALPCIRLAGGGVLVPPGEAGDGFTVHLLRRT